MASTIAPRSTTYKMTTMNTRLTNAPRSQRLISFINFSVGAKHPAPAVGAGVLRPYKKLFLVQLQYRHERFLRDLHIPDHLETFLALLLFLEQFLLAGDI